jgi:molybdenum cofactor cytidylyltransferase
MIAARECAAIILAAGRSARFGKTNKLLAPLDRRPLVDHVLKTVQEIGFGLSVAVVAHPEVEGLALGRGLHAVGADADGSQGDSLRKGAMAAGDYPFTMIFLGDMPFITAQHARTLLAEMEDERVLASRADTYLGPPVLLPTKLLASMPVGADQGARMFLKGAIAIDTDAHTIADFDRPDDFAMSGVSR